MRRLHAFFALVLVCAGIVPVTDRQALAQYHDQFVAIRIRICEAIAIGTSEETVVAMHPADGFAPRGRGTDRWVRILYREYHH